ncbi:hypothetical protein FACS1894217_12600 [Clostridia bacterium]|nr:hypothetical protein FACS1894217_12600 [Clostridia bacterium]
MHTADRNPNKKYPIIMQQALTGRNDCRYCRRSYRGANKCRACGFGSENAINGLLMDAFNKMGKPLLLIERVSCKQIEKDKLPVGYHLHNDEIYHLINIADFEFAKNVHNVCYNCRREDTTSSLDNLCSWQDLFFAEKVFNAIDNDVDDVFENHLGNGDSFEYYSYLCAMTGLMEIIIPIYATDFSEKRSKRCAVGLLFLGQNAVGSRPALGDVISNEWSFDSKVMERLKKHTKQIDDMRNRAWVVAEKESRVYTTLDKVFESYGSNIMEYRKQIRGQMITRELNFLHSYQSEMIGKLLKFDTKYTNESQNSENLRDRIKTAFMDLWDDFALDELHVFIPDLDLKEALTSTSIRGINSPKDENGLLISIDFADLPKKKEYDVETDLVSNGIMKLYQIADKNTIEINLDCQKLNDKLYEFFSVVYGGETDKTMFGIFLEWNERPFDYKDEIDYHGDFFRTLVQVCAAEIMSFIASSRASRLSSFAEETRHDLSHRLQIMDCHNYSYKLNSNKFFEHDKLSKPQYQDIVDRYLEANKELHDSLSYMKDELDSVNIYREPKPEEFDISDIFAQLRHHYNASWHPRNKGNDLIITLQDRFSRWLYADKVMIRRVVTNLVDNAFKYSPFNTKIYISQAFDHVNNSLVFYVTNFGFGIKEELANKMFDRGAKGKTAVSGKGLGLYIAKEFAKKNNGSLRLVSGKIPISGRLDEKRANGLISDIDFSIYDDVLKYTQKNPDNVKMRELKAKLEEKKSELSSNMLIDQHIAINPKSTLDAIMVDSKDRRFVVVKGEEATACDLLTYAKHEIYQITFQLRFS